MPPLSRMVVPALADLARQLRFAPREALLRDIERAEALAAEIDPDGAYGEAWIVARVTGYAPRLEAPATVVGAALLADLSAFVERLSEAATLEPADLPAGWLDPAGLAARWSVSRKTIDRYRKRGLVARRVVGPDGKVRLAFAPPVVTGFEARQRGTIERAGRFSRIDQGIEERMVRRAARYRRRLGCSLNEAAARIARRFGRSHEAVRQVLRRHEQGLAPGERVFDEPGPPGARLERLAWRAWRRAIDPGLVAARLKRSRASVVRAVNHERARLLRSVRATEVGARAVGEEADTLSSTARENVDRILGSPPATTGLGAPGVTDALAWLESARRTGAVVGVEERLRAQAYHLIIARAARVASGLSASAPQAEALDEAETLLRWAARLKVELVRAHLGLLVRTVESRLGRGLDEVRAADLADLAALGTRAIGDALDAYDPFGDGTKGRTTGRLAAPAGLAVDRAVLRWMREGSGISRRSDVSAAGRAAAPGAVGAPGRARALPRLSSGLAIPDWTGAVSSWQAWVEPGPRVRSGAAGLDPREREFLLRRFGWDGGPPATLDVLATQFGLTRIRVVVEERRLVRSAGERGRASRE